MENTTVQKVKNNNLTIIILAALCGALMMYFVVDLIKDNGRPSREESIEYKNLTNLLIEIHGGTNSGINKPDWSTKFRDLTIAVNKYKMSAKPKKSESAALDSIVSAMRKTQDYWRIDIPTNCIGKKPSEKCISNYAFIVYKQLDSPVVTKEEYLTYVTEYINDEGASLYEHQSMLVRHGLTDATDSISNFFKLHDVTL